MLIPRLGTIGIASPILSSGFHKSLAHLAVHDVLTLTITDPLLIYQNNVALGILKGDVSQLRAAKEFQKLYYRVKDYKPPRKAEIELRTLIRNIELKYQRNSYVEGLKPDWLRSMSKNASSRKLVKVLNDEEELRNLNIPKGFLLNGEVGCGKSMLMDIFAESLPYSSKGRWHYHNFMLWVYDQINIIQKRRNLSNSFTSHTLLSYENEVILFEIASNMINRNTVLILDEFALPDIVAAKIIKLLFTYFFKLGGVLVATSNRLPEELYATDFRKKEFRSFLSILELRCDTLDMNSDNDYRRILSEESSEVIPYLIVKKDNSTHAQDWNKVVNAVIGKEAQKDANEETLRVYGRTVKVPWHKNGIVQFNFDYICRGLYGPADYISMASKFHTFIIDNVPVFSISMKSEARRFITLLDALYECKCQLVVRTEAPLEDLFFPDYNSAKQEIGSNFDQIQVEEMYSKTQLDLISPYRPNVSNYYDGSNTFTDQTEVKNKEETNFTNTKKFTGEDEEFAYKRAVSRIQEMTRSKNWRTAKQWTPLQKDMRIWEAKEAQEAENHIHEGIDVVKERQKNAPGFEPAHFWSIGFWGKGKRLKDSFARRWIKGVDGVKD